MFLNSSQMLYRRFSRYVQMLFFCVALFLVGYISYESLIAVEATPMTNHMDKLVHLLAYGALAVVTLPALKRMPPIFVWIGIGVFGALIEIAQGQMGIGRSAEFYDGLANFSGAFLALLGWATLSGIFKPQHRAKPRQVDITVSS